MLLEYTEHLEQHQDYYTLMEEYSHKEYFQEMVNFMDIAFPEWKTNKGVGVFSAEFLMETIEEYLYSYDQFKTSQKRLVSLYEELVYRYKDKADWNNHWTNNYIEKKIEIDHEEEIQDLLENPNISTEDYTAFFELLREKYLNEYHKYTPYNFDNFSTPVDFIKSIYL